MEDLKERQFEFLVAFFEGVTEKKLFTDPEAHKAYIEELEDRFQGLLYNYNYEKQRAKQYQSMEKIHNLEKELTACDRELEVIHHIFGLTRKRPGEDANEADKG